MKKNKPPRRFKQRNMKVCEWFYGERKTVWEISNLSVKEFGVRLKIDNIYQILHRHSEEYFGIINRLK